MPLATPLSLDGERGKAAAMTLFVRTSSFVVPGTMLATGKEAGSTCGAQCGEVHEAIVCCRDAPGKDKYRTTTTLSAVIDTPVHFNTVKQL